MAQFDLETLMENPQFVAGLSLLGSASPRNEGMLQALQSVQQMRKAKDERAERASMQEYRRQQTEVARQTAAKYGQQVELQRKKMEQDEDAGKAFDEIMKSLIPQQLQGRAPTGATAALMSQQPQPPVLPGQPAQAPALPGQQPAPMIAPGAARPTNPAEAAMAAQVAEPLGPDPQALIREIDATQKDIGKVSDASSRNALAAHLVDLRRQQSNLAVGNMVAQKQAQQPLVQPAQGGLDPSQAARIAGAIMLRKSGKPAEGMIELSKALETKDPKFASPGSVNVQTGEAVPDPIGERKAGAAETQAAAARTRAQADADREARQLVEQTQKRNAQFAKDKAAYTSVNETAERAETSVDRLLSHPGLDKILGLQSYTNILAIRGGPAKDALNELESLQSKLVNDTLQSIRAASANGASGYGQFTEKELDVVKKVVVNLDPSGDPGKFKQELLYVKKFMEDYRNRSASLYEETTGQPAVSGLPKGARKVGTSEGRAVYQLPDGTRVRGKK